MKIPITGGCACGAIRYESTAEPLLMLHCHCRDCQRSSRGPFSSFVVVPAASIKLLHVFPNFPDSLGAGGSNINRGFCPECGSPIVVRFDPNPDIVAIRTASLDDPSWFNLQMDVWTSDAHPWDQMNPALRKYERYPTS